MGQGIIDLPDPLDAGPSAAANAAGVDDLLSQLAGDEIDRLLAETNPASTSVTIETTRLMTGGDEQAPVPMVDDQSNAVASGSVSDASRENPGGAEIERAPNPTPEVSSIIASGSVEKVIAEAAARDVAANPVIVTANASASEAGTSSAERSGLVETPNNVGAGSDDHRASPDETRSTPLWLRPIEWLSAPLNHAGAGTVDIVGKIAILTTVNALGVLAYVMIFRKH